MEPKYKGKVRDIYDISGESMVIVTTDRLSAYDVILPVLINGKGVGLNKLSNFWFKKTESIIKNHIITADTRKMPEYFHQPSFKDRTVMVKKIKMLPFEFVVRGYIFGNMWKAYTEKKPFCGYMIEGAYKMAEKLAEPIMTPSTKVENGHDEYVGIDYVKNALGSELAEKITEVSLRLYKECSMYALTRGIIIADTKFEFGLDEKGGLVLADEIFTPDSSRFWNLAEYAVGSSPKSYDKQLIRDWLTDNKEGGEYRFDKVPAEVIRKTEEIYQECLKKLTE
jgi:phosphoribosylaminoimidazole-succinocarboxamide synthase